MSLASKTRGPFSESKMTCLRFRSVRAEDAAASQLVFRLAVASLYRSIASSIHTRAGSEIGRPKTSAIDAGFCAFAAPEANNAPASRSEARIFMAGIGGLMQ